MKYNKEFRQKFPETIGEKDRAFDLSNYSDFMDSKLTETQSEFIIARDLARSNFEKLEKAEVQIEEVRGGIGKSIEDICEMMENGDYNLNLIMDNLDKLLTPKNKNDS